MQLPFPVCPWTNTCATARRQLNAQKLYGYDAVFSVMDVSVETEGISSVLQLQTSTFMLRLYMD